MHSQEWFPVGGSWYYNQVNFFLQREEFRYFEVIGDTVIQGKMCRIVDGICQCSEYSTHSNLNYLHTDGDQIYRYDPLSMTFQILYDFTLVAGDTLRFESEEFGTTLHVVDSVGTYSAGNISGRLQYIRWIKGGAFAFGETVYEFLGSDACLYPMIGTCDPGTYGIRCYEDPLFGLISFQDQGEACDHITSGTHDIQNPQSLIFPNPGHGLLTITSNDPIVGITCTSMATGLIVHQLHEPAEFTEIQLSDLPPGGYLIRCVMRSGATEVHKLIMH
jgi:hypothetical protein